MAKESKKSAEAASRTGESGRRAVTGKATVTVALNRATGVQFTMPDGRRVVIVRPHEK